MSAVAGLTGAMAASLLAVTAGNKGGEVVPTRRDAPAR